MYVYSLLLGDGIGDHSNFTTLPFCFLLAILCPCNNKALPLRALGGDLQSVAALSTLRHTVTVITVAAQPGGRLFTFRRRAGGLRLRPRAVRASPLPAAAAASLCFGICRLASAWFSTFTCSRARVLLGWRRDIWRRAAAARHVRLCFRVPHPDPSLCFDFDLSGRRFWASFVPCANIC